ncbi:MAG: hypothetical protein HC845_15810 [Akkermansiaceae bacterium]|nr:hypothetical protein [Akkermansiaceae bacterium]
MKSLLCIALLCTATSHAALLVNYGLGGSQITTTWDNLRNSNPSLAPSVGVGNLTVAAPGGQFSVGLYSFADAYSTTAAVSSSFDVQNVVFQADLAFNTAFSFPFSGGPLLSYNGGAQNILPMQHGVTGTESRVTSFGTLNYTGAAWQWDLSGVSDEITSISIISPFSVHTSVAAQQIDLGASFAALSIPEPSSSF